MAAHAIAYSTRRAGRPLFDVQLFSVVMMDTAAFRVVYVDRRVSQERDLDRDDPLPVPAPAKVAKTEDSQFHVESEETVSNIQALLSVFYSSMFIISAMITE